MKLLLSILPLAALGVPATASAQSDPALDPAPGYAALLSADYARAEREIRAAPISKYDPARAINLGIALAMNGRPEKAAKQFRRAMLLEDVEMVTAAGHSYSSRQLALHALQAIERNNLQQR